MPERRQFQPTDEQKAILDHDPAHHARILAGPGTGKSSTLVELLARLGGDGSSRRLRMLTFTRVAASELAAKSAADSERGSGEAATIHSFAISVLLRNEGAADILQPLRIADDWGGKQYYPPSFGKAV